MTVITVADLRQAITQNDFWNANDTVILSDTDANLATLSAAEIYEAGGRFVDCLNAEDGSLALTVAQLRQVFQSLAISSQSDNNIEIYDTGENIALDSNDPSFDELVQNYDIGTIHSPTGVLSVDANLLSTIENSTDGISAGDTVVLRTSLAEALAGPVSGLVDLIDLNENQAVLSVAQALALQRPFVAEDAITLQVAGAELAGLADAQLAQVGTKGIDRLDVSDNAASLSLAQYAALAGMGLGAEDRFLVFGTATDDLMSGRDTADTFKGAGGADRLSGGLGHDQLWGGAGKDVLTGGSGQDVFVFDTKLSKSTNLDKVTDFNVKDDAIWLENKYLTKVGKGSLAKPGKLASKAFYSGSKAHDGDDRVLYNKKTGVLSYDADGTGSKAAVEIAILNKNLKLTHKDFFVI